MFDSLWYRQIINVSAKTITYALTVMSIIPGLEICLETTYDLSPIRDLLYTAARTEMCKM